MSKDILDDSNENLLLSIREKLAFVHRRYPLKGGSQKGVVFSRDTSSSQVKSYKISVARKTEPSLLPFERGLSHGVGVAPLALFVSEKSEPESSFMSGRNRQTDGRTDRQTKCSKHSTSFSWGIKMFLHSNAPKKIGVMLNS